MNSLMPRLSPFYNLRPCTGETAKSVIFSLHKESCTSIASLFRGKARFCACMSLRESDLPVFDTQRRNTDMQQEAKAAYDKKRKAAALSVDADRGTSAQHDGDGERSSKRARISAEPLTFLSDAAAACSQVPSAGAGAGASTTATAAEGAGAGAGAARLSMPPTATVADEHSNEEATHAVAAPVQVEHHRRRAEDNDDEEDADKDGDGSDRAYAAHGLDEDRLCCVYGGDENEASFDVVPNFFSRKTHTHGKGQVKTTGAGAGTDDSDDPKGHCSNPDGDPDGAPAGAWTLRNLYEVMVECNKIDCLRGVYPMPISEGGFAWPATPESTAFCRRLLAPDNDSDVRHPAVRFTSAGSAGSAGSAVGSASGASTSSAGSSGSSSSSAALISGSSSGSGGGSGGRYAYPRQVRTYGIRSATIRESASDWVSEMPKVKAP
jgi:hypothetical protein